MVLQLFRKPSAKSLQSLWATITRKSALRSYWDCLGSKGNSGDKCCPLSNRQVSLILAVPLTTQWSNRGAALAVTLLYTILLCSQCFSSPEQKLKVVTTCVDDISKVWRGREGSNCKIAMKTTIKCRILAAFRHFFMQKCLYLFNQKWGHTYL